LCGEIELRFISIDTLLRMEQAADREQDHIGIAYLQMLQDENDG